MQGLCKGPLSSKPIVYARAGPRLSPEILIMQLTRLREIEARTGMIAYQMRKVYLPGIDAREERLWDPLLGASTPVRW